MQACTGRLLVVYATNALLTAVTIGADQLGCLTRRPQAKSAYLGKDTSGAGGAVLLNCRLYNGE
jgi:hypothetical protein